MALISVDRRRPGPTGRVGFRGHDLFRVMPELEGSRETAWALANTFVGSLGECMAMMVQIWPMPGYTEDDVVFSVTLELGEDAKREGDFAADLELPDRLLYEILAPSGLSLSHVRSAGIDRIARILN